MADRNRFSPLQNMTIMLFFALFSTAQTCNSSMLEIIDSENYFDNCEIINGDITIDNGFKFTNVAWRPKEIIGCVTIQSTNLRNIDFLINRHINVTNCTYKHKIVDNQNLCLDIVQQRDLYWILKCTDHRNYGDCIEFVNGITCPPLSCNTSYFDESVMTEAKYVPKCEILEGDFNIIINSTNQDQWEALLSKLTQIQGKLTIHNEAAKDLSAFFPQLRLINLTSAEDKTISITNDNSVELLNFDMPRLERILFPSGTTAKFEFTLPSNTKMRFNANQRRAILMAMGPGGELEVFGQKEEANMAKEKEKEQVKQWKKIYLTEMDEDSKWTNFMIINAFLTFGVSTAIYVLCCDELGTPEEIEYERLEWEQMMAEEAEMKRTQAEKETQKTPKETQKTPKETQKTAKEGKSE